MKRKLTAVVIVLALLISSVVSMAPALAESAGDGFRETLEAL